MINVVSKRCETIGCEKYANFGLDGERPKRCVTHKLPGMTSLTGRKCIFQGCSIRATYGLSGGKATHCSTHKLATEVDVVNAKCSAPACTTKPSFGQPGGSAIHCFAHKSTSEVDVVSRICAHPGCGKQPCYGLPDQPATMCSEHKQDHMVTKAKMCQGCNLTRPSFGYEWKKPTHCGSCKSSNMTNVVTDRCTMCNRMALYGENGGKPIRCSDHKDSHMVDVINRQCAESNCNAQPNYGLPGTTRTHCSNHKTLAMVRIGKLHCTEKGCNCTATHGNDEPIHCELHALEGESNLVERKCSSCDLLYVLDENNQCTNCGATTETQIKKERLAKQSMVKSFLDGNNIKYDFYDRGVDSGIGLGCTRERPDFVLDVGTHWIILEVDEFQHRNYKDPCECVRMINIAQTIHRKGVFIRFNPDSFKKGSEVQRVPIPARLEVLKSWIDILTIESNLTGVLQFIQLYYDEFDKDSANLVEIDQL